MSVRITEEPVKLIEVFFPDSLSAEGRREAHSLRTANVWFWRARRTEAVTSALCILSCLRPGEEETFWNIFAGRAPLQFSVLDPFCGSGTTVRVVSRMGGTGVGGDISHIAIVSAMASVRLRPSELRQVCEEIVWPSVRHLFTARCYCGQETDKTIFFYGTEQEGERGKRIILPDFVEGGFVCCDDAVPFSICPKCGQRRPVSSLEQLRTLGKITERDMPCPRYLVFVAGVCSRCGKFVRRATEEDQEKLRSAEREISPSFLQTLTVPLRHRYWRRLRKEGVRFLYDLLTPRGILTLQLLFQATEKLEPEIRNYVRLFVTNSVLRTASRLAKWTREGLTPFAGEIIYSPVFCEVSPLREKGFVSLSRSLERAVGITEKGKYLFFVGDATRIPFPDQSFDAVVTDPPYYDLIGYEHIEELAAFIVPPFPKPQVSFTEMMTMAMKECARTIKTDGVIVFSFQYPSSAGWMRLAQAIRDAGLVVTAVHSANNDRVVSLHRSRPRKDTIVVCRKAGTTKLRRDFPNVTRKEEEEWGIYLARIVNWGENPSPPQVTRWTQEPLW